MGNSGLQPDKPAEGIPGRVLVEMGVERDATGQRIWCNTGYGMK